MAYYRYNSGKNQNKYSRELVSNSDRVLELYYFFVCMYVSLSISLPFSFYVRMSTSPPWNLCLSLFMCLSLTSFFHVLSLAVYLSSLFSHSSFIFLSLAISVCLSVPFSISISLSPYLSSIFLSIGNGLWLDLCRSVYSRSLPPLHYFSLYLSLLGYISLSFTLSLTNFLSYFIYHLIFMSICLSFFTFLSFYLSTPSSLSSHSLSTFLHLHPSPLI